MCTKVVAVTLKGEMQRRKCAKKLDQLLRKYVQANLLKYWVKERSENVYHSVTVCHTMKYNTSGKNTASLTLNDHNANVSLGIMPHIMTNR